MYYVHIYIHIYQWCIYLSYMSFRELWVRRPTLSSIFKLFSSVVNIKFHCVNSVQIRGFFWSVFSCVQTEYAVNLRIQSEYRKIQTRKSYVFGHFSPSVQFMELVRAICEITVLGFLKNPKQTQREFVFLEKYVSTIGISWGKIK